MAFNFCQPLLLTRSLSFFQEPVNEATNNIGYGLIGAYILVYTGLAVSAIPLCEVILSNTVKGLNGSVPAHDIPRNHHGSRYSGHHAVQESQLPQH